MLTRALIRPKAKSEAEKPFWISYADLMTAMMMLFLATMAATVIVITREVQHELSEEERRASEIRDICNELRERLKKSPWINVDCRDNRINFGELGRFQYNDYRLPEEAGEVLAALVPEVLSVANSDLGRKWLKQVVIEGYTDTVGSYLYNLHLSLLRSEWVMCLLIDSPKNASLKLTPEQVRQVKQLFLAGGVSFNNARESAEESRRVEMRLQFYGRDERDAGELRPAFAAEGVDRCQL